MSSQDNENESVIESLQEEILELKKLVDVQSETIRDLTKVDVRSSSLRLLTKAAFETGEISFSRAMRLMGLTYTEFSKLNWSYCVYLEAVAFLEEIVRTSFESEHITKESMDQYLKDKASLILEKIHRSRLTDGSDNG